MYKYDRNSPIRRSDFLTKCKEGFWRGAVAPFMWILAGATWLRRLLKGFVLGTQ